MADTNLAHWYAKFRGSATFLWGLLGFIALWLGGVHGFLHMDQDFGVINLILSSEASVSLAFFAMMQEQTDMQHAEVANAIKTMLENSVKTDQTILEVVKDIHEDVEDINEH